MLAERKAPLDTVDAGEVAMVHESGGCFVVEDVAREAARAAAFEISATGPIFGTKVLEAEGEARLREQRVLERFVRLDASRKQTGSGLGLSFVAAVAKHHGAQLELSDAGPGLAVSFIFPAEKRWRPT